MAEQKTTEIKEVSIEDRLRVLYDLQCVVSEIDKIKTLRGELPLEVQDLEDEIAGLITRVEKYSDDLVELKRRLEGERIKIEDANIKIAKNTEQQNNVRNNREFDALTKEIEFQHLEIELAEKHIREYTAEIETKSADLETFNERINERREDLKQKKGELSEIVAETKQEEEHLRAKVQELENQIEPIDSRLLKAFKRIRKNVHNGLAVVSVERDACAGCFNKIPPQRQLDIRQRKKIIVCEYCGRILVDQELTLEQQCKQAHQEREEE